MTKHYDYIAIGGGSGGIASINRAAMYGQKCALIEAKELGGTCVNVGCVPKKVMWHAAQIREAIHMYGPDYGFDTTINKFNWETLIASRTAYIDRIHTSYENVLGKNNVDVIKGFARFVDAKTLEVNGETITADHILIATGGRPSHPDIPGVEYGIDSDGFFALPALPERVAVVGAGYIAVELAGVINGLGAKTHLFVRKHAPLKSPAEAIKDPATFKTGWVVLLLLLVGFFVLEPLGIPVSAIAAVGALILFVVAKRGHAINTGKVLRGAPWQIVIFSLGMYLVVYGLRNAGLTEYLSGVLNVLADNGLWAATLGTGFLTAFLSSIMNNMPTVLVGALSIDGSTASGVIKEAMVYANVIGCDLGPKITPIGSLATLLWLHVLSQKNMTISWGYYFRTGIIMTLPVLFVTLAALALRLSFTL
ncbi:FAD-dependent oxidoreductase [Escherichia coli]|nr:FAD-dependent oxidoreductase [Escherichia coli]